MRRGQQDRRLHCDSPHASLWCVVGSKTAGCTVPRVTLHCSRLKLHCSRLMLCMLMERWLHCLASSCTVCRLTLCVLIERGCNVPCLTLQVGLVSKGWGCVSPHAAWAVCSVSVRLGGSDCLASEGPTVSVTLSQSEGRTVRCHSVSPHHGCTLSRLTQDAYRNQGAHGQQHEPTVSRVPMVSNLLTEIRGQGFCDFSTRAQATLSGQPSKRVPTVRKQSVSK